MKMTTEDAFVETRQRHGIRHAFGINGKGGLQEIEQMNLFRDCGTNQEEVRDPTRIAEILTRAIARAHRLSGPAQINVPRDFRTQVMDVETPGPVELNTSPGGEPSVARAGRKAKIAQTKSAWAQELSSLEHEKDEPGTTGNQRARNAQPDRMSPRMAWRAIQHALPRNAIISSDIANTCPIGKVYPHFDEGRTYLAPGPCGYGLPSIVGTKIGQRHVPVAGDGASGIAVNELTDIGRGNWPAIPQIVFRNDRWGAEKRNSSLRFDDNVVEPELDTQVSCAGIARACGLQGVAVETVDELTAARDTAIRDRMERGRTILIEIIFSQDLGEPLCRDATKKPVRMAGASTSAMNVAA